MKKIYNHGELCIFSNGTLPEGVKRIKPLGNGYKVADSETTGNHHMIEAKEGVELYEKDGVMYLKNDVPTDVYCVIKERHDNITLEPGVYEITPSQEYDYLTMEKRNVAD